MLGVLGAVFRPVCWLVGHDFLPTGSLPGWGLAIVREECMFCGQVRARVVKEVQR